MKGKKAKPIDFSHMGEDADMFREFYDNFIEDGMVKAVMELFIKAKADSAEIADLQEAVAEYDQKLEASRVEVAELREAVRVMGNEIRVYRGHVGACNALNGRGGLVLSRLNKETMYSNLWEDAMRKVNANAIAVKAKEDSQ